MKMFLIYFKKNIIFILIFILIRILIWKFFDIKTYEISYTTYPYYYEINGYGEGNGNHNMILTGRNEKEINNKLKEILYLNYLCVGDSLEIHYIKKLK